MKSYMIKTMFLMCGFLMFFASESEAQKDKEQEFRNIETHADENGVQLEVEFHKGEEHYYPLFAIWVEDTSGNYINPLYVVESIATGVFERGKVENNQWVKGEKRIPAALPFWGHKHGYLAEDSLYLPTRDHPLPDAYTGATPTDNFILNTSIDREKIGEVFRVLFEINQSWDWNEYWYNSKYPGNKEYLKSAQPALVYATTINLNEVKDKYKMKPIGHSHPFGATGELFEDTSTLTTALQIAEKIIVRIK